MKLNSSLLVVAVALALAGCASTPDKVNSGPIRARTFSFIQPGPNAAPAAADNRQPVHAMIQDAITKNLAARGVSKAAQGGDITVAYMVIIGDNVSTEIINTYFGYREDTAALEDKAHAAYTGAKNPNYYKAGTLVIDMIEARSNKLLKRGHATREVLQNIPADARTARIQDVVNEILRDLSFSP